MGTQDNTRKHTGHYMTRTCLNMPDLMRIILVSFLLRTTNGPQNACLLCKCCLTNGCVGSGLCAGEGFFRSVGRKEMCCSRRGKGRKYMVSLGIILCSINIKFSIF